MKNINEQIKESLEFDSLSNAEKITGKSCHNDKLTQAIGFVDFIRNNKIKKNLLSSVDDTCFHETESEYMRKVTNFGFREVLLIPFINENEIEERLHIMWHDLYSILLVWDTFTWEDDGSWAKAGKEVPPPSRNGGTFYYNWIPNNENEGWGFISSGGFKDNVWIGSHDCREALKFNINNLVENGIFLQTWTYQPFLWLLHYMDTKEKGYDYKSINKQRISMLPEDIQQKIRGKQD